MPFKPQMTPEEFEKILNTQMDYERDLLIEKANMYVRDGNRLHNFLRGAVFSEREPESVLFSYVTKHIVALSDVVKDVERTGQAPSMKVCRELITDIRNYMVLLFALLQNRANKQWDPITDEVEVPTQKTVIDNLDPQNPELNYTNTEIK